MKTETFSYFCMGALIGAAATVLFTPKSGPETRRYLRSNAIEVGNRLRARTEQGLSSVADALDRGGSIVKERSDVIVDAFDAGQKAVREATHALR